MARLAVLEELARQGKLDLLYGDESQVSSEGYVPYGWQFPGESVCVLAQKENKVNCFGLISRQNQCHWAATTANINAQFVMQELEKLSLSIHKETVVVLDCARIHTGSLVQQTVACFKQESYYLFFTSLHARNAFLVETLWRKLKGEW